MEFYLNGMLRSTRGFQTAFIFQTLATSTHLSVTYAIVSLGETEPKGQNEKPPELWKPYKRALSLST